MLAGIRGHRCQAIFCAEDTNVSFLRTDQSHQANFQRGFSAPSMFTQFSLQLGRLPIGQVVY